MVYLAVSYKDRTRSGNKQTAYNDIFQRSLLSYNCENTDLAPLASNRNTSYKIFYSRLLLLF